MPISVFYTEPLLGRTLTRFLCIPGPKQTQKALEKAQKELFFGAPFMKDFAEGKIRIGAEVQIKGRWYEFVGADPELQFPEALYFWDSIMERYAQFTIHAF